MELVPLTGNSRASRRLTTSTQLSIKLSSCRHQDLVSRAPAQRCGGILFEVGGWREHPLGSVGSTPSCTSYLLVSSLQGFPKD